MSDSFDLLVVGTGSAATSAAFDCREAGWRVGVVDSRPFGGTCALRGCDPKKVLVGAAELYDWARRMSGKGLAFDGVSIDWASLMDFKRTFTEPFPGRMESAFREAGISAFHGEARFSGKETLRVGDRELSARYFLIACGSEPAPLGIPGERHLVRSDQFLDLSSLPRRVVFVGGGYIAVEFANVAARAGAEVTILHRGERLLKGFDPDLSEEVRHACEEAGIAVVLDASVERVEKGGSGSTVFYGRASERLSVEADLVVHSAGRIPEIGSLGLDAAGVSYDERGVIVDEYLQSVTNPRVYAAGDCARTPGMPLTPVAVAEGSAAGRNMLGGAKIKVDYTAIPTVVFSIPPLASVGLSVEEATRRGTRFRLNRADTAGWYSSRRTNLRHSGYKVLIEEGTGRLLGAHLLGSHAEEVINLFSLAIQTGMTAEELKGRIYSYPTSVSDIRYML